MNNKLYIFQENESYCTFFVTFAESAAMAKQKVLYNILKNSEGYEDSKYYKDLYDEILNDKWIVKQVADDVFQGEWS